MREMDFFLAICSAATVRVSGYTRRKPLCRLRLADRFAHSSAPRGMHPAHPSRPRNLRSLNREALTRSNMHLFLINGIRHRLVDAEVSERQVVRTPNRPRRGPEERAGGLAALEGGAVDADSHGVQAVIDIKGNAADCRGQRRNDEGRAPADFFGFQVFLQGGISI